MLRNAQKDPKLAAHKYLFFSVVGVLIFSTLLSSIHIIIFGQIIGPILSVFLIILALAIGIEFNSAVDSDRIHLSTVFFLLLGLGIVIWPSLYFIAYLVDTVNPQSVLLTKIGGFEFTALALGSTLMPVTIVQLTEHYL